MSGHTIRGEIMFFVVDVFQDFDKRYKLTKFELNFKIDKLIYSLVSPASHHFFYKYTVN